MPLFYNERSIPNHPRVRWCECGDDADYCDCERRARLEKRWQRSCREDIIARGRTHPLRRHNVKLIKILEA